MSPSAGPPAETHIYRTRLWLRLLHLLILVIVGGSVAFALALLISTLALSGQSGANGVNLQLVTACIFSPVIVLLALVILELVVDFIQALFAYIKISPDGIENKTWPYRHIRAGWSDVDRLGKFLFYDVLYLKSFTVAGLSLAFAWPLKYFNLLPTSIFLSQYNGWPDGELAADLRRYAPRLFEKSTAVQETQFSNFSGVSQENRLLAALSHASILLTGPGILIPLVIYLTQRRKSAFLAFHALQAFIFQLVATLLGILLPFCLLGAVFFLAFSAYLPGSSSAQQPIQAVLILVAFLLTALMVFGGIACIAYGLVGAALAYQGKEFRYILIGKRLETITH